MMEEMSGEHLLESNASEIPIEHLDYSYIRDCNKIDELRDIVSILKSGRHGFYPHLVEFTEDRIKTLNPNEKKPLDYTENLSKQEKEGIHNEIQEWLTQVKSDEQQIEAAHQRNDLYPPIRGLTSKQSEEEVERRDTRDVYQRMSQPERERAASRERLKGNECMRGAQYQEAVHHYSTSIEMNRCTIAINNRAQAYIKLKKWENAVEDCSEVLREQPENVKALYRRGRSNQQIGRYQQAVKDFEAVIEVEPHNETARNALKETMRLQEKHQDKETGTRIPIEETGLPQRANIEVLSTGTMAEQSTDTSLLERNSSDEESEEEQEENTQSAIEHLKNIRNSRRPAQQQSRTLLIQELDNEASSELSD